MTSSRGRAPRHSKNTPKLAWLASSLASVTSRSTINDAVGGLAAEHLSTLLIIVGILKVGLKIQMCDYIYLRMLRSKGGECFSLVCVRISSSPFLLSRSSSRRNSSGLPTSRWASLLAINNNPGRADSFFFRHSRVNISAYNHGETFVLRSFSRSAPT